MRLNSIKEYSEIYGFETSFVIWTQGCSIRCKDCWNKFTWDPCGGYEESVSSLLEKIRKANVNSVTILGGEPLDQPDEVYELCKGIKDLGKGLILYTGRVKEIVDKRFFEHPDILITGPFIKEKLIKNGYLIGSSNQEILYLTERYNPKNLKNGVHLEVEFDMDNPNIEIVGYPYDFEDLLKNEK